MATFLEASKQIQTYLLKHRQKWYKLGDKDHKLPLTDSLFCAEDCVRNRAFWNAIKETFNNINKNNDDIVVIDAGSGTGILGLFALLQGAKKCYFIEENPFTMEFCKQFLEDFGFYEKSIFLREDATQVILPEKYDILISETLTSGFVEEDFLSIITHFKQFSHLHAKIIPEKFILKIDEIGDNKKVLATQTLTIISDQLKNKQMLLLRHPATKQIRFHTDVILAHQIEIKGNSCMSVLNDKLFSLKDEHQFFEIVTKL